MRLCSSHVELLPKSSLDDEVCLMQIWSFHVASSHEFGYFCYAKLSCLGTWSHYRLWFIYQFNNFALYHLHFEYCFKYIFFKILVAIKI